MKPARRRPTTRGAVHEVDLGARCFQVAAASRSLLVTCKLDDLVLRIDPWDMAITQRRSLASPRDILARDEPDFAD